MKQSKRMISLLWAALLFSFTVYAALDTFVIEHPYSTADEPTPAAPVVQTAQASKMIERKALEMTAVVPSTQSPNTPVPETPRSPSPTITPVLTDTSYNDGNISITLQTVRAYGSTIYVADVILASPEYLQTSLAHGVYGRNVKDKTSNIAKTANAILAVNGDYYGARESGYVIRNGILYRSKAKRNAEDLVIYRDGSFEIINESEISAQTLLENGAWNVLSFGPALLIDGNISVDSKKATGQAKANNPRTAIGIVDKLHYLFVVSDGRTKLSDGLSLRELAQVLQGLGATIAYNLDGGGSSTMVFLGRIVNNPTSNGRRISERSVSDIVCITG